MRELGKTKQEISKERKIMQAARLEMERRIGTLERHVSHCEGERAELLERVAAINLQIEEDKTLAASYRDALKTLAASVRLAVTYRG